GLGATRSAGRHHVAPAGGRTTASLGAYGGTARTRSAARPGRHRKPAGRGYYAALRRAATGQNGPVPLKEVGRPYCSDVPMISLGGCRKTWNSRRATRRARLPSPNPRRVHQVSLGELHTRTPRGGAAPAPARLGTSREEPMARFKNTMSTPSPAPAAPAKSLNR